jgi:hypothetical protein
MLCPLYGSAKSRELDLDGFRMFCNKLDYLQQCIKNFLKVAELHGQGREQAGKVFGPMKPDCLGYP